MLLTVATAVKKQKHGGNHHIITHYLCDNDSIAVHAEIDFQSCSLRNVITLAESLMSDSENVSHV